MHRANEGVAATQLREAMGVCPLVAILRWITPPEVEDVAAAVIEEGVGILEVPLNSPDDLVSIERLARRFRHRAVIGAGTVMSPDDARMVSETGATRS